ncbi:hypothetical protein ABFS83_14G199100 [Erythranthe nasuta]
MGRKRKTAVVNTIANEDKVSNACADEKIHSHAEYSNSMEGTNAENKLRTNSDGFPAKKKKSRDVNVFVRRSGRLKNLVSSSERQGVKPLVEHIDLDENEKEDEKEEEENEEEEKEEEKEEEGEQHFQEDSESPVVKETNSEVETETKERNMEENVDYFVEASEEFKSKVALKSHEGHSSNFSYKSLYIDSQKKIEALMEANYALVRKLDFALGKVEAYEKMNFALGASKEVFLVSTMSKQKEATISLSPQTVEKRMDPPPDAKPDATDDDSKRKKKNYKRNAKA